MIRRRLIQLRPLWSARKKPARLPGCLRGNARFRSPIGSRNVERSAKGLLQIVDTRRRIPAGARPRWCTHLNNHRRVAVYPLFPPEFTNHKTRITKQYELWYVHRVSWVLVGENKPVILQVQKFFSRRLLAGFLENGGREDKFFFIIFILILRTPNTITLLAASC